MKNENFAERLFCDLRNAEIKIVKASYQTDGHRIGDGPLMKQLHVNELAGKFNFSYGPAFQNGELTFTQAYQDLLTVIKSIGPELKFYSLVIPRKACVEARLEEFDKVVTRYIVDYLPISDQVAARWDVLVGPAE